MGLGVTLMVVVLVSISLGCGFDFAIHTTFKGVMLADKMEEGGCRCVCGRSSRCFQVLVVLFRLVRRCALFTFKISYPKTAPQIDFLGVHSMFISLSLSWLKGRLRVLFFEGT